MNLDKSRQLFLGCKIDSKLNDALNQAKPGDKRYFEDPDSEFLRICEFPRGEKIERWIGKSIKGGLALAELEDMQVNILSILRRITSGVRIAPSSLKFFAIAGAGEGEAPETIGDAPSGPYIANY